jgi:D-glycero-D-manno-heptose 1,7-bisphosphate phosphatase
VIEQAIEKYPEINLEESFMIGDSTVDLELAINMGIKGFGVDIGHDTRKIIYTN